VPDECLRPAQAGAYAENKGDITWVAGMDSVTVRFRARLFESEMRVAVYAVREITKAPTKGALWREARLNIYAATVRAETLAGGTAASRMPRMSPVGQQSSAPAVNVLVHISSSATRWLQMMRMPSNSCFRASTSARVADSRSRIIA